MEHSASQPGSSGSQPAPEAAHHAGAHAGPPVRTYFMVYGALLVLLVLTVAVAEFHLGAIGIVVALLIAIIKAMLVLLYFMHLRYSTRLTWLFAGAGFAWLLLLFTLIFDYLSRGWVGS